MQRRLFTLGLLGVSTILFLASCRAALPRPVPPEEAVRRTVVRNALLDSVAFDARVRLVSDSFSGSIALTGSSLRGGSTFAAAGALAFARKEAGGWTTLHGPIRFITDPKGRVSFETKGLSGPLADALSRSFVGGIDGVWWTVFSGSGSRPGGLHASPDAAEVNGVLANLSVLSGSDVLRADDGEFEYAIAVGVSTGSVLARDARGTDVEGIVWIDARTFVLRRVRWILSGATLPFGPADIVLDVRFSQFDKAPHPRSNVVVPRLLPAKSLLDTILRKPPVP